MKQIYHLNFLTGGIDSTYLDYADGNSLSNDDRAYVVYSDTYYVYRLDATSGAAESSPNIIAPDTNAGTKRWRLITSYSLTSVTTSVTAADNTSSTAIATTAYAKSQDAVLAREPDLGVALTAAASGSSGITVADNDNIDFGTGDFFLCWKGSLPDWTPSGNVILVNKRQDDDNRYQIYLSSATKLVYLHAKTGGTTVTKTTTNAISLVDNSTHEIHAVITRETASVAGSVSFYMDGVLFETLAITASAPADLNNTGSLVLMGYADSRYAGTVHHAYLGNFAPNAVDVLDMYRNGPPESLKWGSQTELVVNANFDSGDTGWTKTDGTWTIVDQGAGDYQAVGTSSSGQQIYQTKTTVIGKRYLATLTCASRTGGKVYLRVDSTYSAALSAAGTVTIDFTATATITYLYAEAGAGGDAFSGKLSLISMKEIGLTACYLPENIRNGRWLDASNNYLDATFPTTGWSLTRPIPNEPVLQNLLTNTQWIACSGSTLCATATGAVPVTTGANAALTAGGTLVANGGFDSAATSWGTSRGTTALTSDANAVETGNCLKLAKGDTSNPDAYQQITGLTIGKLYYFSAYFDHGDSSSGGQINIETTFEAANIKQWTALTSADTKYEHIFEATTTSIYIRLVALTGSGTQYDYFDSITLYEVTPGYVAADTLAPDGWGKHTTTADYFRQHNDVTYTKAGSFYSLKGVKGADSPEYFNWPLTAVSLLPGHYKKFEGRAITLGVWVYAVTNASNVKLSILDDSGWTYSSYCPANVWTWMELSKTITTGASNGVRVGWVLDGDTNDVAYFSQPMLVFSDKIGRGNYAPYPNERIGYQTPFALTGYNNNVPADATINLEAASSGVIGKGVKKVYGYHYGQNTAAAKFLKLGTSSGVVNNHLISQVANVPIQSAYEVKCDANGDMYIDVEDANWSAYYLYVTGIEA